MLQSTLFTKTQKEVSKDVESKNAQLLIRSGYVNQLAAGIYSFLPLGVKVLAKIENIIRQEMDAIGAQEILLPALHPKKNWLQTGRWQELDVLFKLKSVTKQEYCLGPTHEEVVTPLAKKYISSYKDLPQGVYQIQTKFRDEKRAKSGILRGREFRMKDLYSFHLSVKELEEYYEKVKDAYRKIYEQVGIGSVTFLTFASGGSFSKFSHEFQAVTEAGEDEIYLCSKCKVAINKEIIDQQKVCPKCESKNLKVVKAVEVGNIFKLKDKFSKAFNLKAKDKNGKEQVVYMGCYGIGSSRLMGTVVEVLSDERGIVWPEEIAPFKYHLLVLDKVQKARADTLYEKLGADNVLYDDRFDLSIGQRLTESDLMGLPCRLILSNKTGDKVEIKKRTSRRVELINVANIDKV